MPLNPAALQAALGAFFADPPLLMSGDEVNVSGSRAACAQEWADALEAYAAGIIPASTTVTTAATALASSLTSLFGSATAAGAAASGFDAALLTFATSVGGGMAGFTPVPPPAPLGISSLLSTTQSTHSAAAAAFATKIDTWMRTGTATPLPSGSPVNWS